MNVTKENKMNESKQDQSTDDNCEQANNDNENSELIDVDDTNAADSQAIPEGFTPWNGTECPVPLGTMVDVILQTGDVVLGNAANDTKELFLSDQMVNKNGWWNRTDYSFDIIAYRLSEPTTDNVYQAENSDQLDEKLDIPPPQYNPDDVAFKKSDTVFWYTVDGIKEVFETSSDAIHAAQELVKNRKIFATIHAVASKPHAIIKPVVTTELEYV